MSGGNKRRRLLDDSEASSLGSFQSDLSGGGGSSSSTSAVRRRRSRANDGRGGRGPAMATAPSASRMTRMLLVALSVAGRHAKQPTGAPNASHHGGKNSSCRRCVQNEGDVSRWCGRITARDQPGAPDILVTFPLVSIHGSP